MPPRDASSKRAGKRPMTSTDKSRSKKSNVERPRKVAMSTEERINLDRMMRTAFPPTRFLDEDTLRDMGILDEVMEILTHMGLDKFAQIRAFTYPSLAREFFATVELVYRSKRNPDPDHGKLTFKVNKKLYEVSIEDLCGIYGFEHKAQAKFEIFGNIQDFWDLVACGKTGGSPKMSLIRYPPLRIVAKFLANTLFARKECGTMKVGEFALLFSGVHHKLLDNDGNQLGYHIGREVNLGCIFAKSLVNVRNLNKRAREPVCYMGGMIVPLLQFVGVQLDDFEKDERTDSINRTYLTRCETLTKTLDQSYEYKYCDRNGEEYTLALPYKEHTIFTSENLRFELWDPLYVRHDATMKVSTEPKFNPSTWELPRLRMKPNNPQKKFLVTAYQIQDRVNRLAKKQTSFLMRQFKKLKEKFKKVAGDQIEESSEEEMPEWNDSEEERYAEEEHSEGTDSS